MAYTPNTWNTGDVITAEKLNNLEQGVAAAGAAFRPQVDKPIGSFYNVKVMFNYHYGIAFITQF